MATITLQAESLSREAFAPFGDVIEIDARQAAEMNEATIAQYQYLAEIEVDADQGGKAVVSLAEAKQATSLPLQLTMVERHPQGSQMFFPLFDEPMLVVVAPTADEVDVKKLRAFLSNGQQGINYHRGVWHMPMIAARVGQRWLIVDRAGPGGNCEECYLNQHVITVKV